MSALSDVVAEMRDEATALGGDAMVDLNRYADMIEAATREPVAWTETAEITEEQWHSLKRTAAAPAAPGWKLVPVEPTREMKDACDNVRGGEHFLEASPCGEGAAPEPPVAPRSGDRLDADVGQDGG